MYIGRDRQTAYTIFAEKQELPNPLAMNVNATPSEEPSKDADLLQDLIDTPLRIPKPKPAITDHPAIPVPDTGFNIVLTHATADFDSLASAVGLAKLWAAEQETAVPSSLDPNKSFDSSSHVPTFVVLPRGAHPGVQRFLALHKHLFPIRSLKSFPPESLENLHRLALVDAQRRERLGPADRLLQYAERITVVDHHVDQDSDIPATDYVVDKVGSVTTLIVERLQKQKLELSEAEATLLALGIHADTGSLTFDSTTTRDAMALAWCLGNGASQPAIAEHVVSGLSVAQQGVLTQALLNVNSTVVHGVTVSSVVLSADEFIQGLAAVTQDALEMSSSDVFLLGLVYEAQSGGQRKRKKRDLGASTNPLVTSAILPVVSKLSDDDTIEDGIKLSQENRARLKAAFDRYDRDESGTLDQRELSAALGAAGVVVGPDGLAQLLMHMDTDENGMVDFDEFVAFSELVRSQSGVNADKPKGSTTMIIIGRVKAGVNLKHIKLYELLEPLGGGGHAKAASATMRLGEHSEANDVMQELVDRLIEDALKEQPTVGDFMTSPVLSVSPSMTEVQVEDLLTRFDVRALPVVNEENDVIGLVTYKEVAAAKQRLWNKEQKHRREREAAERDGTTLVDASIHHERTKGSAVKGWMKQHVKLIEASQTMAEVELILLQNDVGCMPVVVPGTRQLVGMVTRTDLLRQHRYYSSLHYHNKGFSNSIEARKPIIELRKKLKKFDLD